MLVVGISGLAAFNALYVPLYLEGVIHTHPRSTALLEAAKAGDWLASHNSTAASGTQPHGLDGILTFDQMTRGQGQKPVQCLLVDVVHVSGYCQGC